MDLDRIYTATGGVKCNIMKMVRLEPEWTANMLQYYEGRTRTIKEDTLKEVATAMDEVCPHRKVMGMPVAKWTCSQCMCQLWKSLTEGEMPKEKEVNEKDISNITINSTTGNI